MLGCLGLDVVADVLFEQRKRKGSVFQDDVMELPNVKRVSKLLFGEAAELADFQFTNFVG